MLPATEFFSASEGMQVAVQRCLEHTDPMTGTLNPAPKLGRTTYPLKLLDANS